MSRAIISKKKFSEIKGLDDSSNKAKLDNESTRQKGEKTLLMSKFILKNILLSNDAKEMCFVGQEEWYCHLSH